MTTALYIAAVIAIGILLWFGSYTDFKRREIPNWIPLGIFLCGFAIAPDELLTKFLNLILLIVALVLASVITKKSSGGGDIKVYLSLAFAFNVFVLAILLAGTLLVRTIVKRVRGEKGKAIKFPMCCYLAPVYTVYAIFSIVVSF